MASPRLTGAPDTAAFLDRLRRIREHAGAEVRGLFADRAEVIVSRAPGRLDVMGGIADYSGSLVLQWPIREATFVALQPVVAPVIRLVSTSGEAAPQTCDVPLAVFAPEGAPVPYASAREWFAADPARHWTSYVAGAWLVLMRELGVRINSGARLFIHSSVPAGKGVSSSAALEAAAMRALVEARGLKLAPRDMAILCQTVENLVVGAPCGVMDQVASICGEAGRLIALRCQPAELEGTVGVPVSLALWGIDSGIRHAVAGADYGTVRVGAFMGYRMLADAAGLPVRSGCRQGLVDVDDPRWRGYLANVTPAEFATLERVLPDRTTGREFLDRFGGTTDPVTVVDPARTYPVRAATRHPVFEHARVSEWRRRLESAEQGDPVDAGELGRALGALMYASHESYSACGLGSSGTDLVVSLARAAGEGRGVYGAKITGGGSGGTVALLTRADASDAVEEIASEYTARTGRASYIFRGSSPGAAAFGTMRVRVDGWR